MKREQKSLWSVVNPTFSGACCPVFCRAMMAVRRGYPLAVIAPRSSLSSGLRAESSSTEESQPAVERARGREAALGFVQEFGLIDF